MEIGSMVWSILTKLLDICLVWVVFYYILKNVKNNIKMALILKGVIILLIVKFLSEVLNLYTVGMILEYSLEWGPLALIVVFQPEIRGVLESMGRTQLLGRHKVLTMDEREKIVFELMKSVEYFSKNRIGSLMVIEREISLQSYIENSTKIYADLSDELIETVFFPNSPLHDGGMIIQGDRVTSAGAVFKTSMNPSVSKRLGTRHRAALGIAEESDAVALVVSEETGKISIAAEGELHYNLTFDEFRMLLIECLSPKADIFFDADDEQEDGEKHE